MNRLYLGRLAEGLARAADNKGNVPSRWTASARLDAVIATAAMDEATRAGWCRAQGIFLADIDTWKQDAIAGLGELKDAETEATSRTGAGSRNWNVT